MFPNLRPFQQNSTEKHKELFSSHGSGVRGFIGSLKLKEGAKPVLMKDRPVPYSLVEKVEKEHDRLLQSDILYQVSCNNWASPVVHVPKSDGSIRVFGDYKGINERMEDVRTNYLMCKTCLLCYPKMGLALIDFQ